MPIQMPVKEIIGLVLVVSVWIPQTGGCADTQLGCVAALAVKLGTMTIKMTFLGGKFL